MKVFDVPKVLAAPLSVGFALITLARYRAAILPVVARELEAISAHAAAIPDPVLRRSALQALTPTSRRRRAWRRSPRGAGGRR
jgi:hypothetical protein